MDIDTPIIISFFLFLLAGIAEGTAETLKFHSSGFFHIFRKANPNFWDASISWKNKYKNQDPEQGPSFWQSTKALVSLTDGYHLLRLLRNWFTIFAILVSPSMPEWYMYPAAFVLLCMAFTVGFGMAYDYLFGYKK